MLGMVGLNNESDHAISIINGKSFYGSQILTVVKTLQTPMWTGTTSSQATCMWSCVI